MATESVSDYEGYDFAALWHRREKVTQVEQSFLTTALGSVDCRRVLELGSGFGRLTAALESISDEVVASDFDLTSLTRLRPAGGRRRPTRRVAANLYHLPFGDGTFTAATMVRVYHHLDDPVAALAEIRRILVPGGHLLVSYNPKPSVGTLVNDIQRAIRTTGRTPFRSITFAPEEHLELRPDPFPVHVGPRAEFSRSALAAGFLPGAEMVSGLEEYYLMRYVPVEVFVRVGTALGRAPGFPMRFVVLRGVGRTDPPAAPADELFACPRCRGPVRTTPTGAACPTCGFLGVEREGVLDLRFLPYGTRRWRDGGHAA